VCAIQAFVFASSSIRELIRRHNLLLLPSASSATQPQTIISPASARSLDGYRRVFVPQVMWCTT
jgi:hypothetical protein